MDSANIHLQIPLAHDNPVESFSSTHPRLLLPTLVPHSTCALEEVQKSFTRKIKFDHKLDYWERLKELKMYSQERRRERYRVLYVWKMFENLVPTIHCGGNGGIMKLHPRNGRTMSLPTIDTKCPRAVQKMRDSSLIVHGAKLFNSMPKALRNVSNCSLLEFNPTSHRVFLSNSSHRGAERAPYYFLGSYYQINLKFSQIDYTHRN